MDTSKPKRGRPKKDPTDRRSAELRIRLTLVEREALDKRARPLDTSTWARDILLSMVDDDNSAIRNDL